MDAGNTELGRRKARLDRRAIEKYGDEASSPGGWPDADIFDYTINELAGLPRYMDMLLARLDHYKWPAPRDRAVLRSFKIKADAMALDLINIRSRLRAANIELGSPEYGE